MVDLLPEPLELSAPLARRLAPELCRPDPKSGESCAWCHGIWQYLRLMGLAATPEHHAEFFRRAFHALAGSGGAPRVLISGAADYAMLALVLAFHRERGVEPEVTVVDACDTPLFLNRWYAERGSAHISCVRSDMLEYAAAVPFDHICTHSFLVQFPPEERTRLLRKWHQLLRPGGTIATVTRLRPGLDAAGPAGFTPEQALSFRTEVLRQAQSMNAALLADPAQLARDAETYMRAQRSWPVRSREELLELFGRCGFRVDEISDAAQAAAAGQKPEGPAVPGSALRVQIIATRL